MNGAPCSEPPPRLVTIVSSPTGDKSHEVVGDHDRARCGVRVRDWQVVMQGQPADCIRCVKSRALERRRNVDAPAGMGQP